MLDEIQVENLALIREATLVPSRGLTVLTGETGAGKTALLSALKLLIGERADKSLVRDGESALKVSGRFFGAFIETPCENTEADETGKPNRFFDTEAEQVVVRTVTADGRSRVTLNGEMASVGELAQTLAPSIDLCGQHEHQQLMKPSSHLQMLDAWAEDSVSLLRAKYEEAYDEACAAEAELKRVQEAGAASTAKLEEARFVLRSIDAVDPQPGEYEELSAELARAEHAESLATAADTAHVSLTDDNAALDALNTAISALDAASRYDASLSEYANSLREASYILEDVAQEMRDYRDKVEFDPEILSAQQERMAAMQTLLRTYGPTIEMVLERRAEAAELVSLVDDAAEREKAAQKALDAAETRLAEAAEALAQARNVAAPQFAAAVTNQMTRLEMGKAELVCNLQPLPRQAWTRLGSQAVEFLFKPGSGMQARPLARIASGGEISRVMLAIKVVLGEADQVDTLVFDEVDAGVGGSTAVALADVLADLAQTHQVLVVTHLAQVAVRGDVHYVVSKTEGDMPETLLQQLSEEERPAEIARMLSGEVSETSLAHARELLTRSK